MSIRNLLHLNDHHKGCHPEYKGKGNHPDFPNDRPVHSTEGRFDHHWYLETYKDVANDKCYNDKPYAHYMKFGHKEGRKKYHKKEIKELMRIHTRSFFSLCRDRTGRLLAGDYSFPDPTAYIYDVKSKKPYKKYPGVGESIFSMLDDGRNFWTACEDKGMTFKNHKLYKKMPPSHKWRGAYTVNKIMGRIVFVNAGSVYVDGIGETLKWGNYHNKHIVEFKKKAYVVGYNYDRDRGCVFETSNLRSWKEHNTNKYWRFMDAAAAGDKVYLVGTHNYKGGKHHRNSAALFVTWNMRSDFKLVKVFGGFDYIPRIVTGRNGRTFFGTNRGWRSQTSGCELWEVIHGKPKLIQNFKEAEIRDILVENDRVIVATRTDMKTGAVYELSGI